MHVLHLQAVFLLLEQHSLEPLGCCVEGLLDDHLQRLVVSFNMHKFVVINACFKTVTPKHNSKQLFDLCIWSLCWCQCPRSVCHRLSILQEGRSKSKLRCVSWFRPTPGYSTGGQGHLLPLFSTSLVLSVVVTPTPTLSPSESSPVVAW